MRLDEEQLARDLEALGCTVSTFEAFDERVYQAVVDLCRKNRKPPSQRVICEHLGVTRARVEAALQRLRQAGRLHPGGGKGITGAVPRGVA